MNYKIRAIISDVLGTELSVDINEINDDYDLSMIGVDSLNIVSLIISIEEKYNIEFDIDIIEMEDFKTINTIASTINKYKVGKLLYE